MTATIQEKMGSRFLYLYSVDTYNPKVMPIGIISRPNSSHYEKQSFHSIIDLSYF